MLGRSVELRLIFKNKNTDRISFDCGYNRCYDIITQTLCFHTGMTEAFGWEDGCGGVKSTAPQETEQILSEIHHQIVREDRKWVYSHKVSFCLEYLFTVFP